MAPKISSVKKTATINKKYSRWSTSVAIVDACSGNRGNECILRGAPQIAAEDDQEKSAADQHECRAASPDDIHDHGAVFAGGGVVVVTEQQDLVHGITDAVLRCLHQSQRSEERRVGK